MAIARFVTLNSGFKMPTLGFGTFMLKGEKLKEVLDYALFLGYRHIDTAASYENEEEIGQVLSDRVNAGRLNRKDIFITTKVPRTHLKKADVIESAQSSLAKLKTSYVDMLLVHHPWGFIKKENNEMQFEHVDLLETWQGFSTLFKSQKAHSIGVSNFTLEQIDSILKSSDVPPANVQLECHAYFLQNKLKAFCDVHHIAVSAYAPLGAPNRPAPHVQNNENLLEDPLIKEIAKSYKKTPAQVLLNFLLCRGFVVLPKSANKDRIKENLDVLNWTMTTKDYDKIASLDKGIRFFRFLFMRGHPDFFEEEDF
ncbi:alcohol dehydrogenase [NADP(+)] [Biomphalaria glabrata]|nr:alcohol dehydrogenase [NADP(+)] [Biomphalaria glabrata]